MTTNRSDKKNFSFPGDNSLTNNGLSIFVTTFNRFFRAHRYNNTPTAIQYIEGLMACERGKANMERMEEEVPDSEYRAYQQFISNSKWDYVGLIQQIGIETSELMKANKIKTGKPTGLIVDESSHLKKGTESVGVSRQYAGTIGKVDNCQVGVYCSMVNDTKATLVNQRLFLPSAWTSDLDRCKAAGIPKENVVFKTKPELALEMFDELIGQGIEFDWIGGDGLYGHNTALCQGLEQRNLFYVLDVHKDELIYLKEPIFSIPQKKEGRGRTPEKLRADQPTIRLDKYLKTLNESDWTTETIRKTAKGWLRLKVHKASIWTWDGKSDQARRQTLIITQTTDGKNETKFGFSNGGLDEYSHQQYAYFQAQRYWVERTFQDAKGELGLSDYQVRKWISWHHHHALVMLACLYLLKVKIENEPDYPLISVRDARILLIIKIFGTKMDYEKRLSQMNNRHLIRQADIDRRYRFDGS